MHVLVTGATGYIGGRLVPRLLERGHRVRVLVRDPQRVQGRPWAEQVEVAPGDLTEPRTLTDALHGVEAAYYLVHSMCSGDDWAERDRRAARNFVEAAGGVERVVYLGGLLPEGDGVSEHLRSRAEVGEILRAALPTIEFRAGPIIGSGSASFEMIRYLTERLPAMVAPRWVRNQMQPIAVRDILSYLLLALERPAAGIVEVGTDRMSFREAMKVYARARGLRRLIVPVPVLAPSLAARWVELVTPIPNCLAAPLVAGINHPVIADTSRARRLFPEVEPIPYRRAVELAIERIEEHNVETRWSGSLGGSGLSYTLEDWEGLIREIRTIHVDAPPERVFRTFCSLGGERGWLTWEWAWELRGLLDRLVGGPGLRRGRRDPHRLLPGEALDFWRVEEVDEPHLLRLRAEMKTPGAAWLQWETFPEDGGTRLVQTALFSPIGLSGMLYWYGLSLVHKFIFSDMVEAVARKAQGGREPGEAEEVEITSG